MKIILYILATFLATTSIHAQNQRTVDSLHVVLKTSVPDSVRAEAYNQLAREFWEYFPDKAVLETNLNKAIDYANQCLTISERCGYKRGMGDACRVIASVNFDRGKHIEAIEWNKRALNYRREAGDDVRISASLFALGDNYLAIGDHQQALKYHFECLSMDERRGDKAEAAGIYHNISRTYAASGNNKEALKYLKKALKINQEIGNKEAQGGNLVMMGAYYYDEGNIEESLKCFEEARSIFQTLGRKDNYAMSLIGVGSNLSRKEKYAQAIDSLEKALSIFRVLQDKNGIAWSYNNLGTSYTEQKKFKEAAVCLDSCLRLCKELGGIGVMKNVYQRLYQLDSAAGNIRRAFTNFQLYIGLRDSITKNANTETIEKQQMRFEYSKKEEQEKTEQSKRDAVQAVTLKSLMAGIVLVFLLAVILYNRFRIKKRANILLEEKNQIISNEKEKSDNLLLNILPTEVAEELKTKGTASAKHFDNVSVLFTDFKSFTTVSEQLSPQELVDELHTCFKAFDEICGKYSIEKIKTIGDAYLAVCGLPLSDEKHAENVVHAALEIREFMKKRRENLGAKTFEIRIGINSGSVVAGIVGVKKFAYDIWGDTVNTAARMEQNSEAGKINISETTYSLVKDKFTCEYRGEIDAKNKGMLKMYFVERFPLYQQEKQ
ncbi:MAG: tetratricopeptide repeat protein [Ignavibacteria bacterium]|nr:tetratricopeptide repeat protein [Ignavibacteria bacterium]